MLFGAFPIVFQQQRGWSPGISGLAFLGVLVGFMIALAYTIFYENPRYNKRLKAEGGWLPAEQRLPPAILGGILLPIVSGLRPSPMIIVTVLTLRDYSPLHGPPLPPVYTGSHPSFAPLHSDAVWSSSSSAVSTTSLIHTSSTPLLSSLPTLSYDPYSVSASLSLFHPCLPISASTGHVP